jgi:hypothetical protein
MSIAVFMFILLALCLPSACLFGGRVPRFGVLDDWSCVCSRAVVLSPEQPLLLAVAVDIRVV